MTTSRLASFLAVSTTLAVLAASPSVHADCTTPATFTVTNCGDDGSVGTLRQLIHSASVQDCDTIDIPACTIVLTTGGATFFAETDANADLDIDKSITIQGTGAGSTIIDADGAVTGARVFEIDPDDTGEGVILQGLTVTGGQPASGVGGGIQVNYHGVLTVNDSAVVGNDSDTGASASGGGIGLDEGGSLIVSNSSVSNNTAGNNGGGIYFSCGDTTSGIVSNSDIDGNYADGGGGGIYIDCGTLEVINSRVTNNIADGNYGGGLWNEYGSMHVINTDIIGNRSEGSQGGGINNDYTTLIDNCLIQDNVATSSSGYGGGVANVDGGIITILNSTIDGNRADDHGGGIWNDYNHVSVINTTVSNNVSDADDDGSGAGGGISNEGCYTLEILNSLIINNVSNSDVGGGIYQYGYAVIENTTIADNAALRNDGGGIFAGDCEPTLIRNSTISGNAALGDDGSEDSDGGGIWADYPLLLANTTIANNRASGHGGGIFVEDEDVTLNNVTVTGNIADSNSGGFSGGDGGGIYLDPDSGNNQVVVVTNSIIAGNRDDSPGQEAPDCFNDFTLEDTSLQVLGPNIIQDTSGCELQGQLSLLLEVDPLLDPAGLADNGGLDQGDEPKAPAKTIALQSGSPAINAGDNGSCQPNDQNGVPRPQGDGCDLGAVEFVGAVGPVDDEDDDDDGVLDVDDNCPDDANADQADGDGDGVGDVCDNCAEDDNADQADADGDGIGDACDADGGDGGGGCSLVTATSRSEHRAAGSGMIR